MQQKRAGDGGQLGSNLVAFTLETAWIKKEG